MFESLEPRRLFSITLENGVLTVIGTSGKDKLFIIDPANWIDAGSNIFVNLNDTELREFKPSDVKSVYVDLGGGNDSGDLTGLSKVATLLGGNGNDTLSGAAAEQLVVGGRGNDKISCRSSGLFSTRILGGHGRDTIDAGGNFLGTNDASVVIFGGAGDDRITTTDSTDRISGGEGNDSIDAGLGNDRIDGNDGDDTLIGGSGNDAILGGGGIDLMIGNKGNDTLHGEQDDIFDGGTGDDTEIKMISLP